MRFRELFEGRPVRNDLCDDVVVEPPSIAITSLRVRVLMASSLHTQSLTAQGQRHVDCIAC